MTATAYTLAGLESGVRAYRNLLALDKDARNELMDTLVKAYDALSAGRTGDGR